MESLRTIWNDIRRDLKQNKDDVEIPDMQGWYWTLVVADRMRMQHIEKRRSGAFLQTFVLPVLTDEPHGETRPFVILPATIYDYDLDRGIHSLSYYLKCGPDFKRQRFYRTSPARMMSREMSVYQKARPDHPYFYRQEERLYLEGVTSADVPNIEAWLYTALPRVRDVNPDAPFQFPKELLFPLKRAVIDLGRFALALPGEHLTNDGTNRPAKRASGVSGKTLSVADPLVNTGAE